MKLAKSLLLGAAAGLATVAAASAADLPSRKSAPVEYVRVCNAYGAGFFFIPGTDTCLRVGGLVVGEVRAFTLKDGVGGNYLGAPLAGAASGVWTPSGFAPNRGGQSSGYAPTAARDKTGFSALARVELDARTQTGYGTLRAFARIDGTFGGGSTAATGGLNSTFTQNNVSQSAVGKELTYVNKAFIQFAGITAGRAQSMFDFYADAYNWEALRGSNSTTTLLAYTATFGGGFSATLSFEDAVERRAPIQTVTTTTGVAATAASQMTVATLGGTRMPDVVGNLRVDQGWGSAQLSGALHQVHGLLYTAGATSFPMTASNIPLQDTKKNGFAVQGGLKINLPMLAAGDALYLQATYEKGAVGYVYGNNLAFFGNADASRAYGVGLAGTIPNGNGWQNAADADGVYTKNGFKLSSGYAFVAAFQHYWAPTVSQSIFASYMKIKNPQGGAVSGVGAVGGYVSNPNWSETRIGTNVLWSPVKGFGIGAEIAYLRHNHSRPDNLASNADLVAAGLPAFKGKSDAWEGRVRVQRAF
jgi:hypothetical protein